MKKEKSIVPAYWKIVMFIPMLVLILAAHILILMLSRKIPILLILVPILWIVIIFNLLRKRKKK
jgi:hypothetical protein